MVLNGAMEGPGARNGGVEFQNEALESLKTNGRRF
jgi:hypothetical protein